MTGLDIMVNLDEYLTDLNCQNSIEIYIFAFLKT
jgi:hypothetical protein